VRISGDTASCLHYQSRCGFRTHYPDVSDGGGHGAVPDRSEADTCSGTARRRAGAALWPSEKLDIGEISRRLLLEHMLFTEDAKGMVPRVAVKAWDKEETPARGPNDAQSARERGLFESSTT